MLVKKELLQGRHLSSSQNVATNFTARCKHQKHVLFYSSAVCLKTLSVLGRQMVRRKRIARWKRSVSRQREVLSVCSAWRGRALNRAVEEEQDDDDDDDDHTASLIEK